MHEQQTSSRFQDSVEVCALQAGAGLAGDKHQQLAAQYACKDTPRITAVRRRGHRREPRSNPHGRRHPLAPGKIRE